MFFFYLFIFCFLEVKYSQLLLFFCFLSSTGVDAGYGLGGRLRRAVLLLPAPLIRVRADIALRQPELYPLFPGELAVVVRSLTVVIISL